MKRFAAVLLAIFALSTTPAAVLAADCPDAFHRHEIGGGDHENDGHQHVGVSLDEVDRNQNGVICVKHLTEEIHLHIDDLAR